MNKDLFILSRTKVYYGLLREPDVTAFVDTMEDEEEEPQALNTSTSGNIHFQLNKTG